MGCVYGEPYCNDQVSVDAKSLLSFDVDHQVSHRYRVSYCINRRGAALGKPGQYAVSFAAPEFPKYHVNHCQQGGGCLHFF